MQYLVLSLFHFFNFQLVGNFVSPVMGLCDLVNCFLFYPFQPELNKILLASQFYDAVEDKDQLVSWLVRYDFSDIKSKMARKFGFSHRILSEYKSDEGAKLFELDLRVKVECESPRIDKLIKEFSDSYDQLNQPTRNAIGEIMRQRVKWLFKKAVEDVSRLPENVQHCLNELERIEVPGCFQYLPEEARIEYLVSEVVPKNVKENVLKAINMMMENATELEKKFIKAEKLDKKILTAMGV